VGEPERIGSLVSLDDFRELRERMKAANLFRSPAEIAQRESELGRMKRQGRIVGERLSALVNWEALRKPDRLDPPDQHSAVGLAWLESFKPGDRGVCLWGSKGSGKTTLACHLAARLMAQGYTAAVVSAPALLRALVAERWHHAALISEVGAVDVLVLDDMGAESWERGWGGHIWAVADARWAGRMRGGVTILTTNANPQAYAFGWQIDTNQDRGDWDRAIDRIVALSPDLLQYDGPTRRHNR
jgi:DNA replication protein DnaC